MVSLLLSMIWTLSHELVRAQPTRQRLALVPDIFFERIAAHTRVLRSMLLDWVAGEHLLLVGNQGVGKNRISDELLILMQREREYIQLHRDTTVQTLTLSPALEQGRLVWHDSPLVR